MIQQEAYTFCPQCGGNLTQVTDDLLICQHCQKNLHINPLPCNAAIIENDTGEILLVRRARDPQKGLWDLPGGFIQENEDFAASLKREVREELGCTIHDLKIFGAFADRYTYQGVDYPTLGIMATGRLDAATIQPADDVDGYQFFSKDCILDQQIAFPSIRRALEHYLQSM